MVLLVVPVVHDAVLLGHVVGAFAILSILLVHGFIVVPVMRADSSGGMLRAVLIRCLIFRVIEMTEVT